jgi:hypothetical protein
MYDIICKYLITVVPPFRNSSYVSIPSHVAFEAVWKMDILLIIFLN